MAGVHFKKHLIHQCTVQRRTDAQSTSGALVPTWSSAGDVYCRFVQKQERIADESLGFPMVQVDLLLMDTGEDVREADQIVDIILRSSGASVDTGPFEINALLERNTGVGHHLSIMLERVE